METYLEQWMNSLDMSGLSCGIGELFPELQISGSDLLNLIIQGDVLQALQLIARQVKGNLLTGLMDMKEVFLYILILGIVSAMFAEFSDLFAGQQLSQVGFYFLYLLLMTVLSKVFLLVSQIASQAIETILLFMKLFLPTYFMAVGAAGGTGTAAYYYYLTLLAGYLIERILSSVLLPFVYSYVLLALLNGLWPEEKLSLLLDCMQKGIRLVLKVLLGVMTGLCLAQGAILPVADGLKIASVRKTLSALPGIGKVAEGITDLVIGSAVLIKNSVGILLLLLLLAVCLVPLGKIAAVSGLIKLSAAVGGIVSDKRIADATNRVGEGCFLLFQCVFTAMAMFLIVLAIVAYTLSG